MACIVKFPPPTDSRCSYRHDILLQKTSTDVLRFLEKCVDEYLRKESGVEDVEEVSSDDSDKDDENAGVEEKITTYEALMHDA